MDEYRIDFSPLDKLLDLGRIKEPMRIEVEKAMQVAAGFIRKRMPDGASGNLRRAPTAIAVLTEDGVEGQVFIPETNPAFAYAQFVEYGRRPGKMPPYGEGTSLFKWAQRKLTSAEYQRTGKVVKKTPTRQKQILSFSFLVARKIAKVGTKGQHPFELGWGEAEEQVQRIVEAGFQRALAE